MVLRKDDATSVWPEAGRNRGFFVSEPSAFEVSTDCRSWVGSLSMQAASTASKLFEMFTGNSCWLVKLSNIKNCAAERAVTAFFYLFHGNIISYNYTNFKEILDYSLWTEEYTKLPIRSCTSKCRSELCASLKRDYRPCYTRAG